MMAVTLLAAAAEKSKDFAGIPIEILAPALAALIAGGATWFSTRQSRASAHDQVVAQTAAVLQQDNQDLRDEMRDVRAEAHGARIEARELRRRVDQLEDAMRNAGVPIPPEG